MMRSSLDTDWRRVAASLYRKPVDGKIYGTVELDVTDLEAYVARKRKEGLKITLTHIFTLAVARGLKEAVPELNCYIRRGRVVQRKQIDAMVSILVGNKEMSSVRIEHADTLSLQQLAGLLSEGIRDTRNGAEDRTMKMKRTLGGIPWPFRGWLFRMVKFLTIQLGVSLPSIGLSANNFGSFLVTNIGSIGIDSGYPALFPVSNVAFVFVMGGVRKKPWVVNDRVEVRRIMTLSSTLDHRIVDAIHGGKMFQYIKQVARDPEVLEHSR